MPFNKVNPKVEFPKLEQNVLEFWNKNKIFEKSVSSRPESKSFSFFDGPPFATGLPHYGHLLAGTIKDVIPRYKSMQGYHVERIWGWDTHGLPIENIVEQELDIKTKDQVEAMGIDKFNELCRTKVLSYADEWQKIVARTGRWVDMENAYLTMNPEYMESVWWAFSELYKKDLAYEGHKVMPYCPRCATPLSNFEVGQGYKDKRDKAVTVKFELVSEPGTFVLAWTTTPWTLPGNLALSVGPKIEYSKVQTKAGKFILATERLDSYTEELGEYTVVGTMTGKELVGLAYKPVFDYYKVKKKAFIIIDGDHVTTGDGTGIVHTAPAFGEDDSYVARKHGIDFYMPVDDLGNFTVDVPEYAGKSVISLETNEEIIKDLGDVIFKVESIKHSYPHCWRCDTPLIYKGVSSWFVAVEKVREKMLKSNKDIYWLPDHVGHSRFTKLIENAPDWSISRNRFWGTPLPVWKCDKCTEIKVLGSIGELEKLSGKEVGDIHLHKIQDVSFGCDCGGDMKVSGEVFDCWFESGSMPYAGLHYPSENKDKFTRDYPADFIAEGIDQTRGWFYSLLVLSTTLFDEASYKSVIVNGTILAENGQKMSKKLRNYPDPMEIVDRYGADAMRFYLMSSPSVRAEDFRFSEKGVDEVVKKVILTLWNSYSFFVTYANVDNFEPTGKLELAHSSDSWIISELNQLISGVTDDLEAYELSRATRKIAEFIDDLSNWYIRRNRRRFWKSENDTDKLAAYETLHHVLVSLSKLLAPFMPFVSDEIYKNLAVDESVHLADWPVADKGVILSDVNEQVHLARKIVEKGLRLRAQANINVRQPLSKVILYTSHQIVLSDEVRQSIEEELNIKQIVFRETAEKVDGIDVSETLSLNFREAGARLGDKVKAIQSALMAGDYSAQKDGTVIVLGENLSTREIAIRLKVALENEQYLSESDYEMAVVLDTNIGADLKSEGVAREFVRLVQDARKKAGFNVEDRIVTAWNTADSELKAALVKHESFISKETLSTTVMHGAGDYEYTDETKLLGSDLWFGISRK